MGNGEKVLIYDRAIKAYRSYINGKRGQIVLNTPQTRRQFEKAGYYIYKRSEFQF